jgi:hypothetical protein
MSDYELYDEAGEGYTEGEIDDMYDDWVDEVYGEGHLAETYGGARILKEIDPISYNVGRWEYVSDLLHDGWTEYPPEDDDEDE